MRLFRGKRVAPTVPEAAARPPRRRRAPRADGPRTIVPVVETPLARDLDAARDRLRRAIPPVDDEE